VRILSHPRYPLALLVVFTAVWIALAIAPLKRDGWLLENVLVFIAVPFILLTWWTFRLSNVSYTLITAFMTLHVIGAHWTYAEVPFSFVQFGGRNHYDRVVHFSFGLLLAYPVREVFLRIVHARGFWAYYLPLDVTLAFSAVYEIIEWLTVLAVDPQAGAAFLGTQGDEFDPVKDMAMAGLGAVIAMTVTALINLRFNRAFESEMRESLHIDASAPRGEVSLARWLRRRRK
jgi:putative membrane protein